MKQFNSSSVQSQVIRAHRIRDTEPNLEIQILPLPPFIAFNTFLL